MFKLVSVILSALFLVAGVTLGVLNPHPVTIDLFWSKQAVALSILMAVVFVSGMLIGASVMLVQVTRLKWRLTQQKRANRKQADQMVQIKKSHASSLSSLEKNRNALIEKDS